jgi:hypothetical protein
MDIQFIDFTDESHSPDSIRFRDITVEPYPDGRRVKISFRLTPFQVPPDIEIGAKDSHGQQVASTSIIGVNGPEMSLILHLRGEITGGDYTFFLLLGYHGEEAVDRREITISIPESSTCTST